MNNSMPIIETKQFFELSKNHELVLLDFFATWCTPCDYQTEEFDEKIDDLKKAYPKMQFAKIDADKDEGLFRLLGLKAIPEIVVIYKKRIGIMSSGFKPIKDIIKFIKEFIQDTEKNPDTIPKNDLDNKTIKEMIKPKKKKKDK